MTVAEKPQHLQALEKANRMRFARAELKREVRADIPAGHLKIADLLTEEIPDWLEKMPLEDLVLSVSRMPRKSAYRMFSEVPVSPGQEIGWMTTRQRNALAQMLRGWPTDPECRKRRSAP